MNDKTRPVWPVGVGSASGRVGRRGWVVSAATALGLFAAAWFPGPARAQDGVRNFEKPLLTVETEGHRAPVRSLVWRDAFSLISGGQDKVVRVWDFRDTPRLVRALRPLTWRGPAGTVYALALAPEAGEGGQSLLAVAGYGVESRRGDFTVYRLPGRGPSSTGEVAARVRSQQGVEVAHRDAVLTLAFDPAGKVLATGGAAADPTVILWDASKVVETAGGGATLRPIRRLSGHTGGVRRLAFLPPDGRRLVTVGEDRTLRIWDVTRETPLAGFQARGVLNALAVSPDGRSVVAGSEAGELLEFDPNDVRAPRAVLPVRPGQGAVECLAFSPDGRRLAASIKSDRSDTLDPMTLAFDLEVRDMPGGRVALSRRVAGLLYACAFSGDGARLAYSGGMNQAVSVQDVADWAKPPVELKGQGGTVFDLGFTADSRVVGLTRSFDPANPPALYEGFDLAARRSTTVPRVDLTRASRRYNGWTLVGNVNAYRLEAVNDDGRRWRVDLDAGRERLWWSWTFVPPGPGHPRATLAVGCETGVVVYDLETGRRTRFFAGHIAPVVSVVASPDGHWLASGSIDQTVLLYPLAGSDTRPGLGATFGRAGDGSWSVASVERRGFAEAMGLVKGDVVGQAGYDSPSGSVPLTPVRQIGADFWKTLDDLPPNSTIAVGVVRRPAPAAVAAAPAPLLLPSTKRDNPALLLMLDVRREWVLWTPQGYYDTSVDGDARLLGWHVNPAFDSTRPTDFLPIATFAPAMNRPGVIDRLWSTRSLDLAEAAVPAGAPAPENRVAAESPPHVTFAPADPRAVTTDPRGVWRTALSTLKLRVKVSEVGGAKLGGRTIVFGERPLGPAAPLGAGPVAEEELELDLPPGRPVGLFVTATNDAGRERTESIEVEYQPPRPPPPPPAPAPRPRVVVLALGASQFPAGAGLPEIPAADRDAEALAAFASAHLVSADGKPADAGRSPAPVVLTGANATTESARAGLEKLAGLLRDDPPGKGDVVAVVLATHVIGFEDQGLPALALSDTRLDRPAGTTVPARELSELFGRLTDYGCRVVVFLDGVHEGWPAKSVRTDVRAWARDLQRTRRVITFIASNEGPSGPPSASNGLFALGVLNAFESGADASAAAAGAAGEPGRGRAFSLEQFRAAVERDVLFRSNRQQQVGCYIPRGVLPWAPFAAP